MTDRPPVVAVINTSPDIVDMLRLAFEQAGIVVVTALTHQIREGETNLEELVRRHDPQVIVYDIAPPYAANWRLFQHVSQLAGLKDRRFIITSTNAKHVSELAGTDQRIYEIIGKPFDIDQIVDAGREALRVGATR